MWGAMLYLYQKCQPRPTNIAELKVALQSIWMTCRRIPLNSEFHQAIKSMHQRIKANGGHFEYRV